MKILEDLARETTLTVLSSREALSRPRTLSIVMRDLVDSNRMPLVLGQQLSFRQEGTLPEIAPLQHQCLVELYHRLTGTKTSRLIAIAKAEVTSQGPWISHREECQAWKLSLK